jgi:hypothetical protein
MQEYAGNWRRNIRSHQTAAADPVETMLLRAFKACPTASAPQGDLRLNFWISLVVTRCYAYILFEIAPLHNSNVRDDEDDRDPHISIVSLSFSTVRCK